MKENRNAIYITSILTVVTLTLAIFITYSECVHGLFLHPEFIVNCLLGIFAGAILGLIISIINYFVEVRVELTEYTSFINCLNIIIIPIYNLFKGGKRNCEYEITFILELYNFLMQNLHMKAIKLCFILPHTKIERKMDEILEMTTELYKKVLNTKLLIDKYKLGIITYIELDANISELFLYLRNYHGDRLFTNVLTEKHEELIKMVHLKFGSSGKIDI